MLLDRFLSSSVVFPTDYGFVPESIGPDGEDPLDVLVAVSEPTFPGCGIVAKPVAVMELEDQREQEPKMLCVPCDDPNWQDVEGVEDLPDLTRYDDPCTTRLVDRTGIAPVRFDSIAPMEAWARQCYVWIARRERKHVLPRTVGRAVVDEHDLIGPEFREHAGETPVELRNRLGLIVDGGND